MPPELDGGAAAAFVGLIMGDAELEAVLEEPALAKGVEGEAGDEPLGLVIFLQAPPLAAPLLLPANGLPSLAEAALPGEPLAVLILSAYDPSALNTDGWFGDCGCGAGAFDMLRRRKGAGLER